MDVPQEAAADDFRALRFKQLLIREKNSSNYNPVYFRGVSKV
jgi:hypothetical protein